MNYKLYNKLINIFLDVSKLYNVSKDKELFQKYIYSNNINIQNSIYSQIISEKLKDKVELIYNNLISQNVKIITIISKEYPSKLLNIYNPPFVIFGYGNSLSKINSKKVIHIYNDNLSKFGEKVYKYFSYHTKNKLLKIGENITDDIIICYENIFDENYKNNIYKDRIIIPYNDVSLKFELLLGLVDYFLFIEAKYDKITKNIVENILENGREILVVPGNIFNKNHYFSNYLIQEGASVLLNKRDIDKLI